MRKLQILVLLVYAISYSQNKQVLYDFAGLPQTLMMNPGAEVGNKFHIGFPILSQISVQGGFTGFSTYDIFADNGVDINDKIRDAIHGFGKTEFTMVNQQLEILSGGYRLKNNDYLSFGYYQELDFLAKIPRDLVDLFYEGNTNIGRRYSMKKMTARAEMLGVLHVGLSKKINDKWQIGGRAKIYSSVFNGKTKQNKGTFYTEYGTNNIYKHNLENVDFLMQTSGMFLDDYDDVTPSYVQSKLLFGGNLGLGLDVGFTHHLKKQWTVSGSIQDIGFIYNTKDVETYQIKHGYYQIEGIQVYFDPNNPEDYWEDLKDDFDEKIVLDTIYKKYISIRPVKLNGAVSYSFGRPYYDDCRFLTSNELYTNKLGFHLYSTIGAVHSYLAATLFYERRVTKHLDTKFTYTVDPFSYSNLGVGLSTQFGAFNTYFIADNLLKLNNVYNAKSANFQLGINFIFNNKN